VPSSVTRETKTDVSVAKNKQTTNNLKIDIICDGKNKSTWQWLIFEMILSVKGTFPLIFWLLWKLDETLTQGRATFPVDFCIYLFVSLWSRLTYRCQSNTLFTVLWWPKPFSFHIVLSRTFQLLWWICKQATPARLGSMV
jgi:hypothetical protein